MKAELAMKLAQAIHHLHLDGNAHYTNQHLADVCGVKISTIKRHRDMIKILDTALYITEGNYGIQ